MELTRFFDDLLAGRQQIVSHDGTGQYQATSKSTSIGTSSCGLAALNCARKVFQLYQYPDDCGLDHGSEEVHDKDLCLLYRCLSRQSTEDVMAICLSWANSTHLDVDEILVLPIFKHAFNLVETTYGQINPKELWKLLQRMVAIEGIAAAVITRPPEIVLCLKVSASGQTIFIVFDSHPRPSHPMGSGFTLNPTVEATAACLDDLLLIDSEILSDPSLSWQAQTLGHFSAHILVPRMDVHHSPEVDEILMDATTKMLQLMVELSDLKSQHAELIEGNDYLLERLRLQSGKGKSREVDPDFSESIPYFSGSNRAFEDVDSQVASSEELARSLQAKFDSEDQKRTTEHRRMQTRHETFECGVCFETFQRDFVARIKGCKHRFCRDCLRQYATTAIEDRRYPIPCPTCIADRSKMPMKINDDLLQTLGISNSTYTTFQELQLTAHSITLHCRRCKETMFVDRAQYQSMDIISCPLRGCNHVWCKKCERSVKRGGPRHSCDGSSELEHLVTTSGWRHCPGCQTVIQKESGCNHMTCATPNCNTHFCYVCGKMMTKSLVQADIRQAVSAHYQECKLFDPAT